MKKLVLAAAVLAVMTLCPYCRKEDVAIKYPVTKKVDQVDDYFGTKVADPYRWLEDDKSAETGKWVEAQNAVTFGYLEKIPFRERTQEAPDRDLSTIRAIPRPCGSANITSSPRTTGCRTSP